MRCAYLIPAYQARSKLKPVLEDLRAQDPDGVLLVVDDGSSDGTTELARAAGVEVVRHEHNRGKGVALRTGFGVLLERGFDCAVTVDADGQHRAEDAVMLARHPASPQTLLLGVRDMARDGAPKPSQFSNRFSNLWVSWFSGHALSDTQCGLRRYPLGATLGLDSDARGYGFECEMLVRAARRGIPIVEVPVRVIYPPAEERLSHFHAVRDPARIVARLVHTALTVRRSP
ncbi:MAG TPA: glycosyltransferase family 2 protein [Polyangiaceae bacterium]